MTRIPERLALIGGLRALDLLGARLAHDLFRQRRFGDDRLRRRGVKLDKERWLFGVRASEALVDGV